MADRVLRSDPDKTNLLPSNKQEDPTVGQLSPSSEFFQQSSSSTMELNSSASIAAITSDLQMVMQMLHKMQVDANNGVQELKKMFTSGFDQVNKKLEHLMSMGEQGESNHAREMKNIQDQVEAIKVANSTTTVITDQPASNGNGRNTTPQVVESGSVTQIQSHNLLIVVLDKQTDELKPGFSKKQENVDIWIKKIDKLAKITKMPHDEVFMLAKVKLQGVAEKCKLIDTFGPEPTMLQYSLMKIGFSCLTREETRAHRWRWKWVLSEFDVHIVVSGPHAVNVSYSYMDLLLLVQFGHSRGRSSGGNGRC